MMKSKLTIYFLTMILLSAFQPESGAQSLKVSDNKRFLQKPDGSPFFYLGDTAWELFHRLDRKESEMYLKNRADKGFTVIQAVVLAEQDGLKTPNAVGEIPLINLDPAQPNEKYFQHVDFVVDKAEELGLYIGMLPTWGDKFNLKWGVGPEVFSPENAEAFGEFLGKRYKNKPIIWILGGDRSPEEEEDFAIIRAMAKGIKKGDGGKHLMTYHPMGGESSAQYFHHDEWLDFNMFQSGHGLVNNQNYKVTLREYNLNPVKPVLDGEPCYEDHPVNWRAENGWFDEFDSRRTGYWSMLAGACGHTYGNHNIWQMWQPGRKPVSAARTPWHESVDYPGAFQAGYMRRLFESRPWQMLVPDKSLVRDHPNSAGKEVLAAMATDRSCIIAYAPYGSNFKLNTSKLKGDCIKIWWFNPRIGKSIFVQETAKTGSILADPPSDEKRGNDWVLVVDNAGSNYPPPE